jgi:hypothetical protein
MTGRSRSSRSCCSRAARVGLLAGRGRCPRARGRHRPQPSSLSRRYPAHHYRARDARDRKAAGAETGKRCGSATRRRAGARVSQRELRHRRDQVGAVHDPRQQAGDSRAHRVLRPGGRLLLLEHVRSPSLPVRAVQRLLNPLAVRFAADHLVREPLDHLAAEGFEVEGVERSKWGIVERVIASKPGVEIRNGRQCWTARPC